MIVYAIRHGESEANRLKINSGQTQVPLSEEGRRMAEKLAPELASVSFDLVYSSDLLRAIETARLALPEIEPMQDPRLRELHIGELDGLTYAESVAKYGQSFLTDRVKRDFTAYGGENHAMQENRVRAFLLELSQREDAQKVAVFCHEGTIKCMLNIVLDTKVLMGHSALCNCAVCKFEIGKDRIWKLLSWNQSF